MHRLDWHFFKNENGADHIEIVLEQVDPALAAQQSTAECAIRGLKPYLIIKTSFQNAAHSVWGGSAKAWVYIASVQLLIRRLA